MVTIATRGNSTIDSGCGLMVSNDEVYYSTAPSPGKGGLVARAGGSPGQGAVLVLEDRGHGLIGAVGHAVELQEAVDEVGGDEVLDLFHSGDQGLGLVAALDILTREHAQRSGVRLTTAFEPVPALTEEAELTAYRLVHGENDALPGLVVDRYDTSVVISLDTAAWLPHLDRVVAVAADLLEPARIVLRTSRTVANAATTPPFPSAAVGVPADAGHAGRVVWGDPLDDEIVFLEHGVRFGVDLLDGQKTGHFLDQRDNRRLVASHSRGRDVLDVFCCTGGFGVHAAVGGARSVLSVDQSKSAIAATIANMERNRGRRGVDSCEHDTACGDAFEVLARLRASGRRFDVIVVDPPAFARRQREVDSALAAYRRLTRAALDVAAPDVQLFQASCSSRVDRRSFLTAIDQAVHESGWTMLDRTVTGAPADHPVGFADGSYLDATILRLRRNDQSPGRTARRSRARRRRPCRAAGSAWRQPTVRVHRCRP